MLVASRAATEFMDRTPLPPIGRVVLPMPITAHQDNVVELVLLEPIQEVLGFMPEAVEVGMIVPLHDTIGADNRIGGDNQSIVGIASRQRLPQPGFLLGPPNRFFRTIGHGVG